MNKNILMLCYYYPPLKDVGCKRSVAFARYLKKHGWSPYVISVKNPDKSYCSLGNDAPPAEVPTEYSYSVLNMYKLLGKMNGALSRILKLMNINITRNYFSYIFCIPDLFWGWIPLTTLKALKSIRKFDINIIYVSCSPFSSALIGVFLKLLTGKPLIIDFRDPFAVERDFEILKTPRFRKKIDRTIQNFILQHTDIFIVNNEDTKKLYIQEYPQTKDIIFAVHNGFEAEYIIQGKADKYQKFSIVYTGEFYFYALESEVFFRALSLLKQKGSINQDNFQFLFYGDGKKEIERIAKKYDVNDLVFASARIPYKDVLNILSKSHLQLLRIVKPMISTKLFEGIPLNVPFLATIPTGEVAEIIEKYSPSSYIVNEESSEKVADAILDAMSRYKGNEIQDNRVQEFLDSFSRENLTLKMINIIEQKLNCTHAINENH